MVECSCTKEGINERGPYIFVEWSCANERYKSVRTLGLCRTVMHKRVNVKEDHVFWSNYYYYYYHFYSVKELDFLNHIYKFYKNTPIITYIYTQLMSEEAARTTTKSKTELSATKYNGQPLTFVTVPSKTPWEP